MKKSKKAKEHREADRNLVNKPKTKSKPRPKKVPPDRPCRMNVRLTNAERDKLNRAVKKTGLTITDLISGLLKGL